MCQWPGSLYDLGPVQHRLAPVEGETCSLSGRQCTGLRASSPPGWSSLRGASVSLCTVGRDPLRETQPCPGKPSPFLAGPEAYFPCTESSDLAVAGQALVVGASLMGIMKPRKLLEASQVAEAGGRFRVCWGTWRKPRPRTWVAVSQAPSKTHCPAPHSARPQLSLLGGSEGAKEQHLEEGRDTRGGAWRAFVWRGPLPLPAVSIVPWRAASLRPRASQAREGAMAAAPPPAAPSRGCFPETNAPLRRPTPTSSTGSLADGLPLVVAGRDPKAAGEGRELWGPRTAGCAGDVAPSRDDRGRWCQGCLRGGLPRAHPYLPPVPPARVGQGRGLGGGRWGLGGGAVLWVLSWAAARLPCGPSHCRF